MTKLFSNKWGLLPVLVLTLLASTLAFSFAPAQADDTLRRFEGDQRRTTSALLADTYVKEVGEVDTLIIASADTMIDAVISSGVAAFYKAPVILTPRNTLNPEIDDAIRRYDVSRVVILGGEKAIDSRVEAQIRRTHDVQIVRIGGNNRYQTAAMMAEVAFKRGNFCQREGIGAIVLDADKTYADAIPIGPLAYSLGIPVLLTKYDSLPNPTRSFITDHKIKEVMIVGGPRAVSRSVEKDLIRAGASDTFRVAGRNRYETAVRVAEVIEACQASKDIPDKDVRNGVIIEKLAMVNDRDIADSVSAAPVLGEGIDGDAVIPVLMTDGVTLDESLKEFLVNIPEMDEEATPIDIELIPIGDHSIMPEPIMAEAFGFATSFAIDNSPMVKIIAAENAYEFRLEIRDDDFTSLLTEFQLNQVSLNGVQIAAPATFLTNIFSVERTIDSVDNTESILVCLFGNTGSRCNAEPLTGVNTPATSKALLSVNDNISIIGGVFEDQAGNISQSASYTVLATNNGAPEIQRARLTDPRAYEAGGREYSAQWEWAVYDASFGGNLVDNYLTINARHDVGIISGAIGNQWTIQWEQLEGSTSGVAEVGVTVNSSDRILNITFDGDTTLGDLVSALNANQDFGHLFTVSSDASTSSMLASISLDNILTKAPSGNERSKPTANVSSRLAGGLTVIEISLEYDQIIRTFDATGGATGFENNNDEIFLNSRLSTWFAPNPTTSVEEVVYRVIGRDINQIPKEGDIVVLPAGVATSYLTDANGYIESMARTVMTEETVEDCSSIVANPFAPRLGNCGSVISNPGIIF